MVKICSGAGEGRVSAQAAAGDADAARAQDPDGAGQEPRRRAHGRGRRELEIGTKTVREGIENCDLKTLGANCHNNRMDLKVVTLQFADRMILLSEVNFIVLQPPLCEMRRNKPGYFMYISR